MDRFISQRVHAILYTFCHDVVVIFTLMGCRRHTMTVPNWTKYLLVVKVQLFWFMYHGLVQCIVCVPTPAMIVCFRTDTRVSYVFVCADIKSLHVCAFDLTLWVTSQQKSFRKCKNTRSLCFLLSWKPCHSVTLLPEQSAIALISRFPILVHVWLGNVS